MMSACDIAFGGNPGNTFPSFLRNLVFERRPLHARHVFLFVIHPGYFNKIKQVIFFSASTTSHPSAPQLSIFASSSFVVVPLPLFLCTMTLTPISVEFTVPLVPKEPMVSGVDYYVYSRRIEYQSISAADCIFHSPQSSHLVAIPAPIYLKFLAGALTGGVGSVIGNPFYVPKTLSQANQGKAVPLMTLVSTMHAEQGMAGFYRLALLPTLCALVC
jgi:hypothetical protein